MTGEIDPIALLTIAIALSIGGFVKGATGSGAPLVAVPIVAAFYDVSMGILVMVIPNIVMNAKQVWSWGARNTTLKRTSWLPYKPSRGSFNKPTSPAWYLPTFWRAMPTSHDLSSAGWCMTCSRARPNTAPSCWITSMGCSVSPASSHKSIEFEADRRTDPRRPTARRPRRHPSNPAERRPKLPSRPRSPI